MPLPTQPPSPQAGLLSECQLFLLQVCQQEGPWFGRRDRSRGPQSLFLSSAALPQQVWEPWPPHLHPTRITRAHMEGPPSPKSIGVNGAAPALCPHTKGCSSCLRGTRESSREGSSFTYVHAHASGTAR